MSFIKSKHYLEELAKVTLEEVCRYPIECLQIADMPDLHDTQNRYGVEVVRDTFEENNRNLRYVESIWGKPISEIKSKKPNAIKLDIKNGIVSGAAYGERGNNPEHLIKTIKRKIDLLNKGKYAAFEKYGLFVFVDTVSIDEFFDSYVVSVIQEVSKYPAKITYEKLYLDYYYGICVCDMNNLEFTRYAINQELKDKLRGKMKCQG